jgi:hypothetical protein
VLITTLFEDEDLADVIFLGSIDRIAARFSCFIEFIKLLSRFSLVFRPEEPMGSFKKGM